MSGKVIAITLCRRPHETKLLFDALEQCYGVEEYQFFISCDHDDRYAEQSDEVWELAMDFGKRHACVLHRHEPRLGIDLNKLFIIPKAFRVADYVIVLEDDTIPAKDALLFFEQVGDVVKDIEPVFSVCGYNRIDESQLESVASYSPYTVHFKQGFHTWGWATWKDRWEKAFGDGAKAYLEASGDDANGNFDWWLRQDCHGYVEAYPALPRIQCITAPSAEHTPSDEWHREHEYNEFGAWSLGMGRPEPAVWNFEIRLLNCGVC